MSLPFATLGCKRRATLPHEPLGALPSAPAPEGFLPCRRRPEALAEYLDRRPEHHHRSHDVKVWLTGTTITTAIPKSRWVDFMARRSARISSSH